MNSTCSFIFFFLFCIVYLPLTTSAQSIDHTAESEAMLGRIIEKEFVIGLSAGYIVDGKITWQSAAGLSDKKEQIPFTIETKNRLASIAKPMTSIALLQLWEQGKVNLDTAIQAYIPDFPIKKEGTVTVRQVLHHISGIAAYASGKERNNKVHYNTLSDALDMFKERDLLFSPGTSFEYTSYGYTVLGRIIEVASGMDYESYMQQYIWDKAGMTSTSIERCGKSYVHKSKFYHKRKKNKIKKVEGGNLSDRIPGGGIQSNVTDILKFGAAVLDGTLIKPSTLEMMQDNPGLKKEGNGYGMGWYLYGINKNYGVVYGHNGAQMGTTSVLLLLPEQKTAIVVLSNTSGAMQTVWSAAIQLFDYAAASAEKEGATKK